MKAHCMKCSAYNSAWSFANEGFQTDLVQIYLITRFSITKHSISPLVERECLTINPFWPVDFVEESRITFGSFLFLRETSSHREPLSDMCPAGSDLFFSKN